MRLPHVLCSITLTLSLGTSSCKTSAPSASLSSDLTGGDGSTPKLCVALRGNGQLIMGHFAAMARITEELGVIEATAGGSSASLSQFLYESIYAHPQVSQCGAIACTTAEKRARIALLLKSLQGYIAYIDKTATIVAFHHLSDVIGKLKSSDVWNRLEANDVGAIGDFITILNSTVLRGVLNPEVGRLLSQGPAQVRLQHAKDVYQGVITTPTYSNHMDDNIIFFRPGVIDFHRLARLLGRMGSFYAGYAPADTTAYELFLSKCAPGSRGLNWNAIAASPAGGSTCGELFSNLVTHFNQTLLTSEPAYPSRIDDVVGKFGRPLVATAILEGAEATAQYRKSLGRYQAGQTPDYPSNFAQVKFGYWGRKSDLVTVAANHQSYTDPKSVMFRSLGETTWAMALGMSPAEPGLSRLQDFNDQTVSMAGWADVSPTHVLKNLGCQDTIFVTRQAPTDTPLALGVAKLLGAKQAESDALYSQDVPPNGAAISSSLQALRDADGVLCTNWNAYSALKVKEMSEDAYQAPMEVHKATLAYFHAKPNLNLRGCSVGATQPSGTK